MFWFWLLIYTHTLLFFYEWHSPIYICRKFKIPFLKFISVDCLLAWRTFLFLMHRHILLGTVFLFHPPCIMLHVHSDSSFCCLCMNIYESPWSCSNSTWFHGALGNTSLVGVILFDFYLYRLAFLFYYWPYSFSHLNI